MKLLGVRGYILEELLASLIQNTGYRLLVNPSQDVTALDRIGAGLVVKGRGGNHQVDVLGELHWIPAFTFPIRLFVEAKCLSHAVGIQYARNAVGVVNDLNQFLVLGSGVLPMQRFSYQYALFSTSGFAKTTTSFAMAHQVSLIDLSTNDFAGLRNAVYQLVARVMDSSDDGENVGGVFLTNLRTQMRVILGTWPEGVPQPRANEEIVEFLGGSTFRADLQAYKDGLLEFLVGVATGPFLLVLQAANVNAFLDYASHNPSHEILLRWESNDQGGRRWRVWPRGFEESEAPYKLHFALPEVLSRWIFGERNGIRQRAIDVKREFFPSITIYRRDARGDHIYRLNYQP